MVTVGYHHIDRVSAKFNSENGHHWVELKFLCAFKGNDYTRHEQTLFFNDVEKARAFADGINSALDVVLRQEAA